MRGGVSARRSGARAVRLLIAACVGLAAGFRPACAEEPETTAIADRLVIVRGAGGSDEFDGQFAEWSQRWQSAGNQGGLELTVIGASEGDRPDRDLLAEALGSDGPANARLWLVLIGHGTFDGRTARFNLRGPDVAAEEMASWLAAHVGPMAIINCSSASGPFVAALSAPERIVLTATRTGEEVNFSRFGGYLSDCIADPVADLDKDGQVSLLEAFLMASRRTDEFYQGESRLVTEHAVLDDNGDARGTQATAFAGIHPVEQGADDPIDGYRAHQWHLVPSDAERAFPAELRERRDALELDVFRLRDRKSELDEAAYSTQLEALLVQLAELYEQAEGVGAAAQ